MINIFKSFLLFTALTLTTITQSFAVDFRGSLFSHDPATLIKDGDTYWHFIISTGVDATSWDAWETSRIDYIGKQS